MIFRFITDQAMKILGGLSLGLAVAVLFLWVQSGNYKNQRDEARNLAKAQTTEYQRVYNETFTAHMASKLAEEARLAKNTQETNNATLIARNAALDSASRYRAANLCLRSPLAAGVDPSRKTDLSGSSPAAGSAESPSPSVELVGITAADHDACTLNTADLGIAVEWAKKLSVP